MKTGRNAIQDLSRDLFLDQRIDTASSNYNAEMTQPRMSRRNFVKYGAATAGALGLGYVASRLPKVYALDSLTIPTLSSNPTIDELKSDYSIQKQMLPLAGKSDAGSVDGEFGMGRDENSTNFVLDYTTLTTEPSTLKRILTNIAVDKTHKAGRVLNKDTFIVSHEVLFNPIRKDAGITTWNDDGSPNDAIDLLPGFEWDFAFTKSYFEPNKDHVMVVAKIPHYYMGPGGTYGLYGIYLSISEGLGFQNASIIAYAPNSSGPDRSTWSSFTYEIPIDIFPPWAILPTMVGSLFATLIALRKNRMNKFKK